MASQSPIAKTVQDTKDAQKIAEEKRALPLPGNFSILEITEQDLYGGPENSYQSYSDEGIFGLNQSDIDQTEDFIATQAIDRLLFDYEAPQELVNILGQDIVENVDADTAYQKLLEKGYTRGDIIDQLTSLERVGLGEGFITEFPKATASGYAGVQGARVTAPFGSPFGPAGMAVTGTLGFLTSASATYFGLDKIEDLIFGDTVPMPSQRGEFEAGRTLAGVGASPAMVFGMSKQGVNLGAADFVAQVAARNKAKEELFKSKQTRFLALQQKRDELLEQGKPLPPYLQGDLQATASTLEGVPINKKVVGGIENLLNRFQKTAKDKPLTFGAYEIASASGSAIGAYIAEQYGPASMVERGGAEILGGVVGSLGASVVERAGRLVSGGYRFISGVSGGPRTTGEGALRSGRYFEQFNESFPGLVDFFKGTDRKKTKAAQEILGRIIEAGEDPNEIIRLLSDPANVEAINSAAASRSPILQVIEAALIRDNQKLAKGAQQAYQETRAALRTNMMELVALGDIDSLAEAAKIQQTLFEDALETRLGAATNAVLDAADKLRGDGTPLSPEELAEKLYDTVNQSIKVARAQERALYQAIPDEEITRFLDPEGNEIDVPYFVERFNSPDMMPKTPELQDDLQNVYGKPIYDFIKRFSGAEELAEFDLEGAIADAVRESRGVSRARDSFEKVSEELPSALDDSAELLKEVRGILPDFDGVPEGSIEEIKLLNEVINNPPKGSSDYIVDRLRGNVDGGPVARSEAKAKIRNIKKFLKARLRVDQVETAAEESARLRLGKQVQGSVEEKPLSVGQLREMASQARSKAAVYRQQGDQNSERILNNMADSFLDTIESVENPDATDALRVARAYSKGFHDTFTRTFAGAITQDTRRQGRKISPEEMAKKILSGGSESARMRYKEIRNIIPFLDEAVQAGRITQQEVDELGSNIDGAFELILRGNRAEMLDPDTGVVNQRSLNKWINDPKNQRLLETFPTLMDDLQDVNKANVLLDETTKVNKDLNIERAAESVVARLALKEYEDPAIAIKDALAEKTPVKSIVQFIQSIRNADRETIEALIKQDPTLRRKTPKEVLDSGLKSSFLKMALLDGGGPFTGEFKAYKAYESLFEPIKYGRGKSSLMDILVAQKVFDKGEANNIKAMLSQLLEFEAKDAAGLDLELGKAPNPALDFWLRVSGAAAGARLQKMLPGNAQAGSLVAAGAGSKYFRQLFQEIPASMHIKAMGDLMQDPQGLALFLRKAKDGQEGAGIARSLARWFIDRGYMTAARGVPFLNRESELFEEFFQDEEQPAAQPAPQPQPAAPQPAVPPVTQAPAPRPEVVVPQQQPRPTARPLQTSMAPPAPQSGSVNPQTAARLSAAFPEDEILAMASPAKSGIGSLMG